MLLKSSRVLSQKQLHFKNGKVAVCQFIKLVKGFTSVQDDVCYVNVGYQCIYQGILKTNLKFYGNQSLQLLIKGSKWNLAITA